MTGPEEAALRARYEQRLRAELAEIESASQATRDARRPVALDQQSVGRLSRMDALQGQAMAAASEARRRGRGAAILAALARLEQGEFGWCDACGEPIGEKQLDLDPTVTRCVACAREPLAPSGGARRRGACAGRTLSGPRAPDRGIGIPHFPLPVLTHGSGAGRTSPRAAGSLRRRRSAVAAGRRNRPPNGARAARRDRRRCG